MLPSNVLRKYANDNDQISLFLLTEDEEEPSPSTATLLGFMQVLSKSGRNPVTYVHAVSLAVAVVLEVDVVFIAVGPTAQLHLPLRIMSGVKRLPTRLLLDQNVAGSTETSERSRQSTGVGIVLSTFFFFFFYCIARTRWSYPENTSQKQQNPRTFITLWAARQFGRSAWNFAVR